MTLGLDLDHWYIMIYNLVYMKGNCMGGGQVIKYEEELRKKSRRGGVV
jgi:hypothetical protein